MTHRIASLTIVAAAALQLSLVSIAGGHPYRTDPGMQWRTRTMFNQSAMRAAHPITQGGTTGGTVNPAINGDHMMHGYNG
jgi:hypothetical protein